MSQGYTGFDFKRKDFWLDGWYICMVCKVIGFPGLDRPFLSVFQITPKPLQNIIIISPHRATSIYIPKPLKLFLLFWQNSPVQPLLQTQPPWRHFPRPLQVGSMQSFSTTSHSGPFQPSVQWHRPPP